VGNAHPTYSSKIKQESYILFSLNKLRNIYDIAVTDNQQNYQINIQINIENINLTSVITPVFIVEYKSTTSYTFLLV
jgi:hypothetical protein